MFKVSLAAIAVLSMAPSALAQSVICNRVGNYTYCNGSGGGSGIQVTTPPPHEFDYAAMAALAAQRRQQRYEQQQEQDRQALAQQVGELVASGHCDDARATALRAGNFDLAKQVDGVCAAPAPH